MCGSFLMAYSLGRLVGLWLLARACAVFARAAAAPCGMPGPCAHLAGGKAGPGLVYGGRQETPACQSGADPHRHHRQLWKDLYQVRFGTILGEKYKTLYTPGSFNTPMGVTRTIREKLTPEHQVFIGEMGARYKGDVAQLCRLVRPQYGILTAIGKQHLETFGSLENVMRAKGELLAGVGSQGCVFLNGDDPLCRQLYENSPLQEKYLFGTQGEGLYMRAEDITVGRRQPVHPGLPGWDPDPCVTRLLGRHNILNVAGAAA